MSFNILDVIDYDIFKEEALIWLQIQKYSLLNYPPLLNQINEPFLLLFQVISNKKNKALLFASKSSNSLNKQRSRNKLQIPLINVYVTESKNFNTQFIFNGSPVDEIPPSLWELKKSIGKYL